MESSLQARGLWAAIEGKEDFYDEYGYRNDRGALELIYMSVSVEMLPILCENTTLPIPRRVGGNLQDALARRRCATPRRRDYALSTTNSDRSLMSLLMIWPCI